MFPSLCVTRLRVFAWGFCLGSLLGHFCVFLRIVAGYVLWIKQIQIPFIRGTATHTPFLSGSLTPTGNYSNLS